MSCKTLRNIAVIGFIFIAINGGGQAWSSESEDRLLTAPEGGKEHVFNEKKLGIAIADRFESIAEVYDISMRSELYPVETFVNITTLGIAKLFDFAVFTVSFKVKTTSGAIYRDVRMFCLYGK